MKMHLQNILNQLGATQQEKTYLIDYFKDKDISYNTATEALEKLRDTKC
jgi:hydroxymethylglutaryl-CoA reductase